MPFFDKVKPKRKPHERVGTIPTEQDRVNQGKYGRPVENPSLRQSQVILQRADGPPKVLPRTAPGTAPRVSTSSSTHH